MSISKAWNWWEESSDIWLSPSEESFFIAPRWKEQGYRTLLDFGCGLGRHSIYFSKQGFDVSAFDLSADGTSYLDGWAKKERLAIDIKEADMLTVPYQDNSFDCLFAYHVISHTDTAGMWRIMNEIQRIIKPGGEAYITLCSKETWSFAEAGYPAIDENTVRKTANGPEKDIPHVYVSLDDLIELFGAVNMEILRIRHIDDCFYNGKKQNSKHYFVLARNAGV